LPAKSGNFYLAMPEHVLLHQQREKNAKSCMGFFYSSKYDYTCRPSVIAGGLL